MIEYIIILFLSFPPLIWFRDGFMLLGHDSGFRFDRWLQLPNLWYSWDPKFNFGVDWSLFKGFLITQLPETIFGQKLTLVCWFAIIGLCMLYTLRSIYPESKYRFFRLFSSIFYMYNFFVLDGWVIGERAKFSLLAALPLGLLCVYNACIRKTSFIRTGIVFGLIYFFLNGGGILPLYGSTIIVLGLAFLYFGKLPIKVIFAFFIPFVLLNAYYIIPNFSLLFSSYGSSLGAQGGIEGLIAWERVVARYASLMNVLRLQGMPTLYDKPWIILTHPLFIIASFLPILTIIFGSIMFKSKNRMIRFLTILIPLGVLFTMGTHPPTGIFYEFAMKYIPGFVMFRSSFYKFAPALWLPMIVLTGFYLNEFINNYIKKENSRWVAWFALLVGLLVYHYPFFTNDIFTLSDGFTTRVKVPEYIQTSADQIKREVDDSEGILVMPKMKEFSPALPADMYTWGFFSLDILPRNATNKRFIANDSHTPLVHALYESIYSGNGDSFIDIADILNVRYILWRSDAISVPVSPKKAQELLKTDSRFSISFTNGDWSLYRIYSDNAAGAVWATSDYYGYTGSDEGGSHVTTTTGTTVSPGNDVIEAECMLCKKDEYKDLVASITFPKTRISPGSPFYAFEQWRQKKLLNRVKNNPQERIDADLSLSVKYHSWNMPEREQQLLMDAVDIWKTLRGRDAVYYAIRIQAYFEALGQEIPSEIRSEIFMSDSGLYRYIAPIREGYDIITSDGSIIEKTITKDDQLLIEVRSLNSPPFVYQQRTVGLRPSGEPEITFVKHNPTKYTAHIIADKPFLLTLNEQFDGRWKLSIPASHVKVNGYANGWLVDQGGTYDVEMFYNPQKYFYIGLWITGISLLSSVYYLVRR